MIHFVPLHRTVLERSDQVVLWIGSWSKGTSVQPTPFVVMTSEQWYMPTTPIGTYLWMPAPAVANVIVENMAREIHKRPTSVHIFVCPRLMTCLWRRMLGKATDLLLTLPIGNSIWGIDQHEPLILAISFPLSRSNPWKYGKTPQCEHESRILSALLKEDINRAGIMLRELSVRAWSLASVSGGVV